MRARLLVLFFVLIPFVAFTQPKTTSAKKVKPTVDSVSKMKQPKIVGTAPKANTDSLLVPKSETDSVQRQIAKAQIEIQNQLKILLELNKNNYDSIKHFVTQGDSALKVKLDSFPKVKEEGFWEGFVKNSIYQWLYDVIFGDSNGTKISLAGRILTGLSLAVQIVLFLMRVSDYFSSEKDKKKPSWWRLLLSGLSLLMLMYSFFSYSHETQKEDREAINQRLKEIEENGNEQIRAISATDYQFEAIRIAIEKQAFPNKRLDSLMETQKQAIIKSQRELTNVLQKMRQEQTKEKEEIVSEVKDYSTHGFWILMLFIVVFFVKDIRAFFGMQP